MEFNLLLGDMLFFATCKFETASVKIVQVMTENIRFAFLYVLSINSPKFRGDRLATLAQTSFNGRTTFARRVR